MSVLIRQEPIIFTGAIGKLSRPASSLARIRLYRNGLRQRQGVDYTVAADLQTITLIIPSGGDYFEAEYD